MAADARVAAAQRQADAQRDADRILAEQRAQIVAKKARLRDLEEKATEARRLAEKEAKSASEARQLAEHEAMAAETVFAAKTKGRRSEEQGKCTIDERGPVVAAEKGTDGQGGVDEAVLTAEKIRLKLAARKARQQAAASLQTQTTDGVAPAGIGRSVEQTTLSSRNGSARTISPFSVRVQSPPSRSAIKRAARQMGLHKTLRSPGRPREGPIKTISSELVLQAKSDLAQRLRSPHRRQRLQTQLDCRTRTKG